MSNRFAIIAASALAALAAGSATSYWILNRPSFGWGQASLPVGVDAVPQDALMTLTISTDDAQWRQLRRLGTDESQAQLDAFLDEWGDRLLSSNGITFEDDVRPWLGDTVTIALMAPAEISVPEGLDELASSNTSAESENDSSFNANEPLIEQAPDLQPSYGNESEEDAAPSDTAENSDEINNQTSVQLSDLNPELIDITQEQAALVFLPVADPANAQQRIRALIESGVAPSQREYQGVMIQAFQSSNGETYEVAAFGRTMLVIATQADAMDRVIDTHQGEPSIADIEGYADSVRTLGAASGFAQLYVNAPVARAIAAANSTEATQSRNLAPWQHIRGITATANLNSTGMTVTGISWMFPDSEPLKIENRGDRQLATRLPDSTLLMLSGSTLKTQWEVYSQRNEEEITEGLFAPQYLREMTQSQFGLDLDADLMGWMDGRFALALASTEPEGSNLAAPGLVFLVEASDRTLAQQTLSTLDKGVEAEYQLRVNEKQLEGHPVVNWQRPAGSMSLTRGWLDDQIAFIGSELITATMVPKPTASLASTDIFRQAMASQPTSNTGTFFLNVEEVMRQREQLPVPAFFPEQAAMISAIRAIGFTVSAEGDRQRRYNISIVTHTNES
ncbi:MAG: DUF3352 domain-containing protein [Leptolyngbyaceae bacterium]|nr:DUF3352 domain-containing protein [Leptolyngbyaceae bacterium]